MEIFLILVNKLIIMFLFMLIGMWFFKRKIITEAGSESLANLLIHLILPCVIINGFLSERSTEKIYGFFISFAFSVICLVVSIFIAKVFFSKNPIGNFAASFSNPGFFGIPLIISVIGQESVFYAAPFIACLNILQWTYGVALLKEEKISINIKNIIKSPFIISFIAGIILFFSQINLPEVVETVVSTSASLNTPIAMLVSGVYLAKANIKEMFSKFEFYKISLIRIIFIPAISCLLLCMVPDKFAQVRMVLFLAAACPVGSNVAVYAQLHGKNYIYAVQTVVLSTILSMITIPLWMLLIQKLW